MMWLRYDAFYIHCAYYKNQKPSPFDNASTPFLGAGLFFFTKIFTTTFKQVLQNFLMHNIPKWSVRLLKCVWTILEYYPLKG